MKDFDISAVVREELGNIAPEIDMKLVDPSANLRDALDIDSMDFLNFVTAIHHRLGIDIPEIDYPKLNTLNEAVNYLTAKLS
ncbi:MAG TPA: phosphopantetheine-binding protein [Methylocella sp.]|nr:phosphopantetheine-binding protein [Methylocella sp.]